MNSLKFNKGNSQYERSKSNFGYKYMNVTRSSNYDLYKEQDLTRYNSIQKLPILATSNNAENFDNGNSKLKIRKVTFKNKKLARPINLEPSIFDELIFDGNYPLKIKYNSDHTIINMKTSTESAGFKDNIKFNSNHLYYSSSKFSKEDKAKNLSKKKKLSKPLNLSSINYTKDISISCKNSLNKKFDGEQKAKKNQIKNSFYQDDCLDFVNTLSHKKLPLAKDDSICCLSNELKLLIEEIGEDNNSKSNINSVANFKLSIPKKSKSIIKSKQNKNQINY